MKAQAVSSNGPNLTPRRRRWFTVVMFLLPLLALALAETLLRLVGYGDRYPLVFQEERFGREKYVVNSLVTRRYFSLSDDLIPEAADEAFDFEKRPGALRVFCLGGSTTAGFPFEVNATFPFQLQYRLREALQNNYVEVVNLGISAINSYTVLDLMPEILALAPDVLIIYMGHNEFYGALGSASTQRLIGGSRGFIRFYLTLRKFRLVQLLESLIAQISSAGSTAPDAPNRSLMQTLAGENTISYDSDLYRTTVENFRENLSEILLMARKQGIAVLTSTLVSNLRDFRPFVSSFSAADTLTRNRCEALLLKGRSLQQQGAYGPALEVFAQIAQLDSTAADLSYFRARSLAALGDTLAARRAYERARDLDKLRFRAGSDFNRVIREVSQAADMPLVDLEAVFRAASPQGIPGSNLFVEHLHPNFPGYQLMAEAFFEALKTLQVINPPEPIGWQDPLLGVPQVRDVIARYREKNGGVTELDLEFGRMRSFFLMHRWPFSDYPMGIDDYITAASDTVKMLASRHLKGELFWDGAHYKLATHYAGQEAFEKAFEEYLAVYQAFHENYFPAMKLGDLYFRQQNFAAALTWYERALRADPENPHLLAKAGNVQVMRSRLPEAIEYLSRALQIDAAHPVLDNPQKTTAYYLLGISYANLKDWAGADRALDQALAITPNFPPAHQLKDQIRNFQSQKK